MINSDLTLYYFLLTGSYVVNLLDGVVVTEPFVVNDSVLLPGDLRRVISETTDN